jgi:NADH:ubiquinone reductase (H+-translocating)
VIIGGGFGGLEAARWLARVDVAITVIDRRNHHLFQALRYCAPDPKVSTASNALSPDVSAVSKRRVPHTSPQLPPTSGARSR